VLFHAKFQHGTILRFNPPRSSSAHVKARWPHSWWTKVGKFRSNQVQAAREIHAKEAAGQPSGAADCGEYREVAGVIAGREKPWPRLIAAISADDEYILPAHI
jgi:hypothetical protein